MRSCRRGGCLAARRPEARRDDRRRGPRLFPRLARHVRRGRRQPTRSASSAALRFPLSSFVASRTSLGNVPAIFLEQAEGVLERASKDGHRVIVDAPRDGADAVACFGVTALLLLAAAVLTER